MERLGASRERAVWFGWVSFFQDLGSKMVVPLLPLFLALTLGASPLVIGLIDGIGAATAALVSPVAARMAHRYRPVWLVRIGYGLSSIAKLALALASSWGLVLGIRVVDRLGKGVRGAPRDLLLAGGDEGTHGRSFGIQQAMDKFGGFLGPLLGLAVYQAVGERFEPVFFVAFIPCAISVALLFRLPGALDVAPSQPDHSRSGAGQSPNLKSSRSSAQTTALGLLGLHSLFFVSVALLLVRATEMGASVAGVLGAYALLRLVTALASYPAGVAVDRLGAVWVVVAGMVASGLALGVIVAGESVLLVWLSLALVGIAEACMKGPTKAWLVGLGPKESKAAVLGDRSALTGMVGLLGGIAVGTMWDGDGRQAIVVFALGCLGVAALTASMAGRLGAVGSTS